MIHALLLLKKDYIWGTYMAQSVEHPVLDFCSGHDLTVMKLSPTSGPPSSIETDRDFSLCTPPHLLAHMLSKKNIKKKKKTTFVYFSSCLQEYENPKTCF